MLKNIFTSRKVAGAIAVASTIISIAFEAGEITATRRFRATAPIIEGMPLNKAVIYKNAKCFNAQTFKACTLERTLDNVKFVDCAFVKCKFTNAQFTNCTFINCIFDGCEFVSVNFITSNMRTSHFYECELMACSFDRGHIEGLNIERTMFAKCDCGGSVVHGVTYDNTSKIVNWRNISAVSVDGVEYKTVFETPTLIGENTDKVCVPDDENEDPYM